MIAAEKALAERKTEMEKMEAEIGRLKREAEKRNFADEHRDKKEEGMKKELMKLKGKLDTSLIGRQSESEMYDEAIVKAANMEKTVAELNAKVSES